MAGHVVLVRHGETAWSLTGQHTSTTDLPLTAHGEAEAAALAPLMARYSFARVLSSPRRRALETVRRAGLGDIVEVSDALAEWNYGEYEGRTTAEILADRPGWSLWRDGAPGGEHANDVGARVDRLLIEVRNTDGNVALFGHGHCLRVVGARWVGLAPEDGARLLLPPASVFVLGYEREAPVLVAWTP
jgi:probable phosphoglycerate mutase